MHVLEEAVEDSVGDGGLAEGFVPHGDGELAGDDGGAQLDAVLDHLENVGGLVGAERSDQEVVDEENVDAGPAGEQTRQAAFGAGDGDVVEQARAAQVERAVAVRIAALASAHAR